MLNFNNYLLMNQEEYKEIEKDINKCMEDNREELVEWAKNNNKFFNPDIYTSERLFDTATKYLIQDGYGKYTDDDIKYLIYYFSKKIFKDLGMKGITADISYDKFYTDYAAASYDYDNDMVTFYMDKFDDMKSEEPDLLNDLMIIFYEAYRATQEKTIRSNKINFNVTDYIIAMETINAYNTNGFYANNYEKLVRDNMAGMFAFLGASQYLKAVKPDIKELSNKNALDAVIETYTNNIDEKSLIMHGVEGNRFKQLDLGTRCILDINPKLAMKYPIILFGFDISGKKKNMVELANDYENLIKLYPDRKEEIDNFYKVLIVERYYLDDDVDTLKDDIKSLNSYIKHEHVENKFYYDLYDLLKNNYKYSEGSKKNISMSKRK